MTFGAHEGGEVVSPRTGRLYPQEIFLVLIFTKGSVDPRDRDTVGRNMSLKIPVTSP